jgi:hypothetical protein
MTRTPYQRLGDAQEAAAKAGTPAPCTENPELWSGEQYSRYQLLDLIHACRICPVLDLCKQYRDDSHRHGRPLTGVVAGQLLSSGKVITNKELKRPPANAVEGHYLGQVTLHQAVLWMEAGISQPQIGRLAGVSYRAVHLAFKRLQVRTEARERAA